MQKGKSLREMPTILLVNDLEMACAEQNQKLINCIAYELACRIYVPNKGVDFDKLVADFGYKEEQPQEIKTLKRKM